ncbi:hypothetical protein O6H91_04G053900 [Diphasiastrum complanatum]|uniref:Uncharacterized protein n=1 Tax=Diphasiastrum complanatum TaxID=34168 RepID=A0ACC2DWQ6_DIPCM|nr:hypothetical protein O6H91_04G053900 [Diphasiastrum complanatum]
MDPLGQPLGHPYGVHVPPAAGISLYPAGLGQQFPPSPASHVQFGLPPPAFQLPYHHPLPSYPLVGPPQSAAAVPIQVPAAAAPPAKGFFSPWEAAPSPMPPPLDYELEKRIEKLVEYVAKNGPQFETMMKEKQIGNPAYAFLFGAEGHGYYRYRLWLHVNGHVNASSSATPSALHPGLPSYNSLSLHTGLRASGISVSPLNPQITPPPLSLASGVLPPSGSFPLGQENIQSQQLLLHQQQPLPLLDRTQQDVGYGSFKDDTEPFKGLGGPLPPDVAAELDEVLRDLTGTKESIKGAKTWFMQRSIFSPALAEALRDYVLAAVDAERQLHVIYLVNDILFSSLQKRINIKELDNEALAFKPFLGAMLGAIYHNAANAEANRDRLVKILGFWGVKEVYDTDTMNLLEGEMMEGPSSRARKPSSSNQSTAFLPVGTRPHFPWGRAAKARSAPALLFRCLFRSSFFSSKHSIWYTRQSAINRNFQCANFVFSLLFIFTTTAYFQLCYTTCTGNRNYNTR